MNAKLTLLGPTLALGLLPLLLVAGLLGLS